MEHKCGIFEKFLKNGQNDHFLGKMSKKAKNRQKGKKSENWPKFAYFIGKMTFLDILPKNEKNNQFSFCNIIFSLKTPILGHKIEFLAIFKFWAWGTTKTFTFCHAKLVGLVFYGFLSVLVIIYDKESRSMIFLKNFWKMDKMTIFWAKCPKRQKSVKKVKNLKIDQNLPIL